ncbi:short-chain fatty acid transporter [Seohaeicola sp. SP36]|uniref:short-chain fatty acid transporter n=1 Tax=unclassified Seohaeicola TaxID=2641111 RepID=UPI00237B349E|nr:MULTISPECIES: short-chain fatty acid transporter [unclassified Seohaeicola]MDD9707471.1 short-chain fatty acid transporter [Seohaeicola sp. 4SK31]MDD9735554.1 short-chain fatty acid transporter [Seohaeicola sp. SP36]
MLRALSQPAVKLMERYLPDPFIFVVLLTLIAAAAAILFEGTHPVAVAQMWGDGFWALLAFSMQMLLVLVTGFILASSPPVKKVLALLAGLAKTPGAAILLVSVVSLLASWINWGFGLVVGALFAKELARQVRVDYRLLIAAAYSGFVIWHGGVSGSIPLTVATPGHFTEGQIGVIGTGDTIFAGFNLIIVAVLFVVIPLVNRLMLPTEQDSVYVTRDQLGEDEKPVFTPTRPAEYLESSRVLMLLIGVPGLLFLGHYWFVRGGAINLNIVNFMFLFLGIVMHGTARNLLDALNDGIKGGAGIVIQFPFYAGIMAIMTQSGLAESLSEGFVSISTAATLPFWTFLSAGIVNLFVPSGGGQWAVQAPVILPAAQALGADISRVVMAVAWGDSWTNLLQPFWALPMLGVAGLKAKDIMGFCLIHLVITGTIIGTLLVVL